MLARRWMGASATTNCMVEQLGLAMIPRGRCFAASGLTSLTTSGTSSSYRKADELSITTAPAAANFGAYSFEMDPPAEKSAMSTPAGSNVARSCTTTSRLPNFTLPPADRALASATTSPTGNLRSANTDNMTSPTAPVAPTTATLYVLLICFPIRYRECGCDVCRDAPACGNCGSFPQEIQIIAVPAPESSVRHRRRHRIARDAATPGPPAPAPASPRRSASRGFRRRDRGARW